MKAEDELHRKFPQATRAECKRFLQACGSTDKMKSKAKEHSIIEQAAKMLQVYLNWRAQHELDDDESSNYCNGNAPNSDFEDVGDDKDWRDSVARALKTSISPSNEVDSDLATSLDELDENNQNTSMSTQVPATARSLSASPSTSAKIYIPQWVFVHRQGDSNDDGNPSSEKKYLSDRNGKTILHVLPARVDKDLVSSGMHSLVVALYLNRKLDRSSEETMTVFIDTRPGAGWPNPSAVSLLGFSRKISNELQSLYPERLEYLIIVPIPHIAMYLWSAVKSFLFKRTIDRVVVAPGSAGKDSPIPKDCLLQHVDDNVLERLEMARLDTFASYKSAMSSDNNQK